MAPSTSTIRSTSTAVFPAAEVNARLRRAVAQVAEDTKGLREPWEPDFDSLAIVGVILVIEDLMNFKVLPDTVVRRGGYRTVDEAVQDITVRLRHQWDRHHK